MPSPPMACGLMMLPLMAGACTAPPVPAQLDGEGATEQVPAIVATIASGTDRTEVATLVRKLDHRDPAVRAFAGEALYRLSGQRFGYRYYRDPAGRRTAVATYERWLAAGMPGPDAFTASETKNDTESDIEPDAEPDSNASNRVTPAAIARFVRHPVRRPAPTKVSP